MTGDRVEKIAKYALGRTSSVNLFSDISNVYIDKSVSSITTSGYITPGVGAGTYVSDTLANQTSFTSYPNFVARSNNGRYFRLVKHLGGIFVEQGGVIPNDNTKRIANTTALNATVAYLSYIGLGNLYSSPGTIYVSNTTLGTNGIIIPDGMNVHGMNRKSCIYDNDNPSADGNPIFTGTGNVEFYNFTINGRIIGSGMTGGGLKKISVKGSISSDTQYQKQTIDWATVFSAPTFNNGANGTAPSNCTFGLSGTTATLTLDSSTSLVGNVQYYYYAVGDYITLDPNSRYCVYFEKGFYTGAGAASPQITLYDGSNNPVDAQQGQVPYAGAAVSNLHVPNNDMQYVGVNGPAAWQVSFITGASKIKIAIGSYRSYNTAPGMASIYDLSKISIIQLVNDFATFDLANLPSNKTQIQLSSCTGINVYDCDFSFIAARAVGMLSCTECKISQSRVVYSTAGFNDDSGNGNVIQNNIIDQRFKDTNTTLRGLRAYRWRAIGGTNSQDGSYINNKSFGASWAFEILPYSTTSRNIFSGNEAKAEFAGASLGCGSWTIKNNTLILSSDGAYGIEVPGSSTDGTGPGLGYENATLTNNTIKWDDFSGYIGWGISASNFKTVEVNGGEIRAPSLFNCVGYVATYDSILLIDGVFGQFASSAILVRGKCSVKARFSSLRAYKPYLVYGSGAENSIFDIGPDTYNQSYSLTVDYMEVGITKYIYAYGTWSNMYISLKEVYNPNQYITSQPIRLDMTSTIIQNVGFYENNIVNLPASMSAGLTFTLVNTNHASSSVTMRNNRINSGMASVPFGISYTPTILRGDALLISYLTNTVIGTLAANAYIDLTGKVMSGLASGIGQGNFTFSSYNAGGLTGLLLEAWPTASSTYTLRIRNISGASITPPTQSIVVRAVAVNL